MDKTLIQQIAYYDARAGEYDEWFHRTGRYDRGPELNQRWFADMQMLAVALDAFGPSGDVLEFACGTGIWTERLAQHADRITALDSSSEMLHRNQQRLGGRTDKVEYVRANIFEWEPPRQFDVSFFGFWLSHVPPDQFEAFWNLVRRALRPGGRFFFADSHYEPTSMAVDHSAQDRAQIISHRRINDGREFDIYKVFYEPDALERRLRVLGLNAAVFRTPTYFIYGYGTI